MPNRGTIISRAASTSGVPAWVLWGIYGAESSFGRARSSFGLTSDYPGTGTSGNFARDAYRSAQIVSQLVRSRGSLDAALRAYSGGSYGLGHVRQLAQQANQPVLGSVAAGGSGGGGQGVQMSGSVTPGKVRGTGFNPGTVDTAALTALLGAQQAPAPAPVTVPTPPSSAMSYLHPAQAPSATGFQPPAPTPVRMPRQDTTAALAQLIASQKPQGLPNVSVTAPKVNFNGGPAAPGGATAPVGAKGVVSFDGKPVDRWIAPILAYARARGWQGTVTSGYRSYQQQAAIYNSGVRPAARPGTSNHELTAYPGGAVDVTQATQLARIIARSPYRGLLQWAGAKDAVHFSHPHNGSY